jgi:hypothetical protein
MKRTELKRGTSQLKPSKLKRGTSRLQAKKPMPWRSEKAKAKYVERRSLVERLLKDRPWCEACPAYAFEDEMNSARIRASEHLHEIVNRSQGGDILDESIILVVCPRCHARIGDDALEAEKLGLHLRGIHYDEEHVAEACRVRESLSDGKYAMPFYWKWRS